MLLEQSTFDTYGYTEESLSIKSNKKIMVKCDYCGVIYNMTKKSRTKAHLIIAKDACKKCKYIKMKALNMIKYGVDNVSKRIEVKDKIRDANIDRLRSDEFKEQAQKTNLRKYGYKHAMQSEEVKKHHKQVFLDKYGVTNPSYLEEVKQKRIDTCLEKFGTEYASQSDEGKRLITDGFNKRFGVDNAFQNEEVKQKIKETHLNNHGVDHHMKVPGKAKEVVKKGLQTKIDRGDVKIYDSKTYPTIAKQVGFSSSNFYSLVNKYGIEKAITLTPQESSLECTMRVWLDSIDVDYKAQFRVNRKIADFFIPSHKIVIECDGLYWHSDAIIKNDNYHVEKRQLYIDKGYTSLFFREHEINNKFDIVKSIISNKFGGAKKLNARQCKIQTINKVASKEFLNTNHLMGNGKGTSYALTLDSEIVCLMRLYPKEGSAYEISRFCPLLNTNVRGGFSRLLKYAIEQLKPSSVTTFIDLRYGGGTYLTNLPNFNFEYSGAHPSFNWTNGKDVFHRSKFPSQSGYDKGLVKIWDCGQAKYILKL